MKITSTKQARNILEKGMIINAMSDDYEIKILSISDNAVECINVEYDNDIQDYINVGQAYYRTFADFVGNYAE